MAAPAALSSTLSESFPTFRHHTSSYKCMDILLNIAGAVAILFHWRIALSFAVSFAAALFLSNTFALFTAGYCVMLVLASTTCGLIWHSRAEAQRDLGKPLPNEPISNPVAFLGFTFIGFFWGGVALYATRSPVLAGLLLVASVALIGAWYRFHLKRTASLGYLAFAAASLLLGYAALLLLLNVNA